MQKTRGLPSGCPGFLCGEKLIIVLLGFEESLRMFACRTFHRGFLALDDVSAVAALPFDFFIAFKEFA